MQRAMLMVGAVAAVVLIGLGVWWWQQRVPLVLLPAPPASVSAARVAPAPPPTPASAASAPAIQYPIEPPVADAAPKRALDFPSALDELFGGKAVAAMFQTQEFARRFVATVDNLGRAQATTRLWPVNPAGGRFKVEVQGDAKVIATDNGARYAPYVALIETVNLRQAVAWYARLYPQLQRAYEELGFPGRYFNDRLVEVIDRLLSTPQIDAAAKVHLPVINAPVPPPRPWVLYEFDDPALEKLSSGQKILLRMGASNERRVKARLVELRRLLTAGAPPR
jgi:Protein of unknown function (DUF3014)